MSFPVIKKWWSKLGEATESLQKLTRNLTSAGSRGASGRVSVLGGRWGRAESPASPGTEGPCPRCVSAQGGSASVATVASENGFRKQQADCQLSADRKRTGKAVAQIKTQPLVFIESANFTDYLTARTLEVNFCFSVFVNVFVVRRDCRHYRV